MHFLSLITYKQQKKHILHFFFAEKILQKELAYFLFFKLSFGLITCIEKDWGHSSKGLSYIQSRWLDIVSILALEGLPLAGWGTKTAEDVFLKLPCSETGNKVG